MSLLKLPNELLYQIADYLDPERELTGLARTNWFLHRLVFPIIYRHNIQQNESSALSWSVENRHPRMVIFMIKHGADLETRTYPGLSLEGAYNPISHNGSTPLHRALRNQYHEMVMFLVKIGAKLDTRDVFAKSPFDYAVFRYNGSPQHDKVIALMISKVEGEHGLWDVPSFTPLVEAIVNDHLKLVRLFLKKGANPHLRTGPYATPLHVALQHEMPSREEMAILLLKRGADPNSKDFYKATPLHYALHNGHERAVALLLEMGADPHARTIRNHSPKFYLLNSFFHDRKGNMLKLLKQASVRWRRQNTSETLRRVSSGLGTDTVGSIHPNEDPSTMAGCQDNPSD